MPSNEPAETPRQRLARLMNTRRADLGMTWREVAERGELTTETLRQVRSGDSDIRELTKRGIERALKWMPGSIDNILGGDEALPSSFSIGGDVVRVVYAEGPTDLSYIQAILEAGLPATEQVNLMRWVVRRRKEQHAKLMSELDAMVRTRQAAYDLDDDPDDEHEAPRQRSTGLDDTIPYTHLAN